MCVYGEINQAQVSANTFKSIFKGLGCHLKAKIYHKLVTYKAYLVQFLFIKYFDLNRSCCSKLFQKAILEVKPGHLWPDGLALAAPNLNHFGYFITDLNIRQSHSLQKILG